MARNLTSRDRSQSPPSPQTFQLQDLSSFGDTYYDGRDWPVSPTRTLNERGQRLLHGSRHHQTPLRGSYSPIVDPSAAISPQARPRRLRIVNSTNTLRHGTEDLRDEEDEAGAVSPLAEPEAIASAMIGLGLGQVSLNAGEFLSEPERLDGRNRNLSVAGSAYSVESFPSMHEIDSRTTGLLQDDDEAHLVQNPQPPGMIAPSTPLIHRPHRSDTHTRRVTAVDHLSPYYKPGDDVESGRRRRSSETRLGSLSPSTPLHRAGTIVSRMSKRIVNISNEPEEQPESAIRRRLSYRQPSDGDTAPDRDQVQLNVDGNRSATDIPLSQIPQPHSTKGPGPDKDWFRNPKTNPFKGNSLGIFPPHNELRARLCDLLIHPLTEPVILLLIVIQTILLAVQSAQDVATHPRGRFGVSGWIDFALLGLFIAYTIEIVIRIIVSGFILNAVDYSTINRSIGWRKALSIWFHRLFVLPSERIFSDADAPVVETHQHSIIGRLTEAQNFADFKGDARQQQRMRLAHRAFLRHSFTRFDFLAAVSFWISFALAWSGVEVTTHIYAFDMLSSLRVLRLLSLTRGTTIILRSLKKAAPLLLNVALLIGFFWLLFAIIGVQSFKSSLRRYCVWVDPLGQQNYTMNQYQNYQFCGGSLTSDNVSLPWYYNGTWKEGGTKGKGYLCPPGSFCVATENPYNGTVSFDNIFQSLELVFVMMTSNTYSDLMYYLSDSDYLVVCLYFAAGIVIMTFWLMNLLIAVITSSFQVIREESFTSAFADQPLEPAQSNDVSATKGKRHNVLYEIYGYTKWLWIAIIVYGLVAQSLRSATMGSQRDDFITYSETVVTLLLLFEIAFRFFADWRGFFRDKFNWVDLFLALITSIMQIPTIHNSGQAYAWLSIFQIARIYRVVLVLTWTRELILLVLGNLSGLLNLILFVFLLTFLAAIFAAQLLRGTIPSQDPNGNDIHITFGNIWNAFIGMYQVLSSENWTILLYNITSYNDQYNTAWIGAIFLILWFILAFFIVVNMFIAVIQENFDVSEDEKRIKQFEAFLQRRELGESANHTLALSALFKRNRLGALRQDPLDYGPAVLEQLVKGATVQDFVGENLDGADTDDAANIDTNGYTTKDSQLSAFLPDGSRLGHIQNVFTNLFSSGEANPFNSRLKFSSNMGAFKPHQVAKAVINAAEQRRSAQREYLRDHPSYNVSLFIFAPDNPVRRVCQRIVGPGRGATRIEGAAPSIPLWYTFSAFLYAVIVAMVLLACITTPQYQKAHFKGDPYNGRNWFTYTDLAFAIIFTIEALIRVIADGFFFAPYAYFRSSWGFIDAIVLITLWLNVLTALLNQGAVSRAVGAFKALRALRLLNVSDSARETFHAVIVRGGWKVLSAAFVSLSLLIPFAIYGLNLFNNQMQMCNDSQNDISNLTDCINEFASSPYAWNVLAPRQVANPYYNFDNFGNSLFILFQIVSQEGWTDVMWTAESITGVGTQPQSFSRTGNAVFFIVFNLLGSVFVLTLFISVFMRNYTEQTGVAFLTAEQRSWLELRKRLRQLAPTKRPLRSNRGGLAKMCYNLAVRKAGMWQRLVTFVLTLHLLLLCSEFYSASDVWDDVRGYIFFGFTLFYGLNLLIRLYGLTWARFRRNAWDMYALVTIFGTIVVSILYFVNQAKSNGLVVSTLWLTMHKLFLVSLVLLLIPRNNQLDQLFKTAAASLTAIANLLATWLVLFLVFAIAMTQTFGLTRFNSNESGNVNFRSVPKALILLFRMSTGEGWNQIMEDFATVVPPLCTEGGDFLDSDCGSGPWARVLFIAWNILSMYIFVNMFISLIFESFSYVYQRHSGLAVVTRQELRRFKQAWAEYDPDGSGYIRKEDLPKLIGELSGVFEMRIYPQEFSVRNLISECKVQRRSTNLPIVSDVPEPIEIDLIKLNEKLNKLPIDEIRRRRREYDVFYQEVMHSATQNQDRRGINFTELIMILAHYKVINDNKSLRLEEFLRRRRRLQLVEDDVQRAIVRSFLDTIYLKTRFRRWQEHRKSGRMQTVPQLQVPEIFIEDEDVNDSDSDQTKGQGSSTSTSPPNKSSRPNLTISIPSMSALASAVASGASPTLSSPGAVLRQRGDSVITASPNESPTRGVTGLAFQPPRSPSPHISPHISTHMRTRGVSDVSVLLGPRTPVMTAGSGPGLGSGAGLFDGPPSPLESTLGTGLRSSAAYHGASTPTVREGDLGMPHTPIIRVSSDDRPGISLGEGVNEIPDTRDRNRDRVRAHSSVAAAVAAEGVWEALEDSAWGASIRRSFSVRRPDLFETPTGGGGLSPRPSHNRGRRPSSRVWRIGRSPRSPRAVFTSVGDGRDGTINGALGRDGSVGPGG